MSLEQKTKEQLTNNLPFVWYVTPNSSTICALLQQTNQLYTFSGQDGFLMAPFVNAEEDTYVLPIQSADYFEEPITYIDVVKNEGIVEADLESQLHFEKIVSEAVQEIKNQKFDKVVLSRKMNLPLNINVLEVFKRMVSTYKNAFCYLYYHPKLGTWMGATPEQLIKITDKNFETVALAGTQQKSQFSKWGAKEILEQQFVTDYILDQLHLDVQTLKVSNPETVEAGNLVHLKTTITGSVFSTKNSLQLVKKLHPTPAVCGLPKEAALSFILANEGYDREFYTGFIGVWNASKGGNLFVNLRCMKINREGVHLFVGCGITKDSNPTAEFLETEHKSMTMRNIL